jgi:hypothetical protein
LSAAHRFCRGIAAHSKEARFGHVCGQKTENEKSGTKHPIFSRPLILYFILRCHRAHLWEMRLSLPWQQGVAQRRKEENGMNDTG